MCFRLRTDSFSFEGLLPLDTRLVFLPPYSPRRVAVRLTSRPPACIVNVASPAATA
jgi:hypothetical protein